VRQAHKLSSIIINWEWECGSMFCLYPSYLVNLLEKGLVGGLYRKSVVSSPQACLSKLRPRSDIARRRIRSILLPDVHLLFDHRSWLEGSQIDKKMLGWIMAWSLRYIIH